MLKPLHDFNSQSADERCELIITLGFDYIVAIASSTQIAGVLNSLLNVPMPLHIKHKDKFMNYTQTTFDTQLVVDYVQSLRAKASALKADGHTNEKALITATALFTALEYLDAHPVDTRVKYLPSEQIRKLEVLESESAELTESMRQVSDALVHLPDSAEHITQLLEKSMKIGIKTLVELWLSKAINNKVVLDLNLFDIERNSLVPPNITY